MGPGQSKWGRWFKYNLTLKKGRGSMGAYAETSETRCAGDVTSCNGPGDRRNRQGRTMGTFVQNVLDKKEDRD